MVAVSDQEKAGFRFDRLIVREVVFRDGTKEVEHQQITGLAVHLEVATSVADDRSWCSSTLTIGVQNGPFEALSATVEGRFVAEGEALSVKIEDFARTHAPAILMPFVRAEIASATRSSRYGQILLPPINVVAITEGIAPSVTQDTPH